MNLRLVLAPALQRLKTALGATEWRASCHENNVKVAYGAVLRNVKVEDHVNVAHHAEIWDAEIGRRSSIGRYAKVRNAHIGSYCSISWDVTIGAVGHPLDHPSTHAFAYRSQFGLVEKDKLLDDGRVRIGNDVWIGCGAIVMPGVSIGDGAVIGAGSIVTKNVESYSIVSGVPAKLMRYRFERDQMEVLKTLQWWDWDDVTLKSRIQFFQMPLSNETLAAVLKETA